MRLIGLAVVLSVVLIAAWLGAEGNESGSDSHASGFWRQGLSPHQNRPTYFGYSAIA
jgi:hypothetical protein